MLKAAGVFLGFALLAGVLAFSGLAPSGGGVATVAFFLCLVACIVTFALGMIRR